MQNDIFLKIFNHKKILVNLFVFCTKMSALDINQKH